MTSLCGSVFITGANRGIGLEFVKAFLNLSPAPEHVFATARNVESATSLKELQSKHPNLHIVQLDVTDFDGMPNVVKQVTEILNGKGLNILLNNAGIYEQSKLGEVTAEAMLSAYKTNTVAPLMLVQAFLPLLKKAAADQDDKRTLKALILTISGELGSITGNKSGGICSQRACKAAMNVINKSLSIDLKPFRIGAVVLHPGFVQTDMVGPGAAITTLESVTGLIKVISSLDDSKTGMFFDYTGDVIPW